MNEFRIKELLVEGGYMDEDLIIENLKFSSLLTILKNKEMKHEHTHLDGWFSGLSLKMKMRIYCFLTETEHEWKSEQRRCRTK